LERVRLDACEAAKTLEKGLRRLAVQLHEASERTPPTITSRQMLEDLARLSQGLQTVAHSILEECGCRGGGGPSNR